MRRALLLLAFLFACSSDADETTESKPLGKSGAAGKSSGGSGGKGGSAQAGGGGGSGGSGGKGGSAQAGQGGSSAGGQGGSSQAGQGGSAQAGSAQAGSGGSAQAGLGGSAQAGGAGSSQAGSGGSAQAGSGGSDAGQGGGAGDPFEAYRQHCVDKINEYRATVGQPPYERWKEGEACADQMADHDADVNMAHDGFQKHVCSPGGSGQNECPGYGSPDALDGCLGQMWAEGPTPDGTWDIPHGHYMNMFGDYTYQGFPQHFSRVACGFSSKGWFLQNFQ